MDIYMSLYMIQYSYSYFFISTLASSPSLGAKLCHIQWSLYVTGVGLTQRKDRDKTDKVLIVIFLYSL